MAKPAADFRSDSDKEILNAPDFFLIRVFQQEYGWIDSARFTAQEALQRYNNILNLGKPYRLMLCAVKMFGKNQHICSISVPELTAYASR
mgnify:CR=1 FL=1